MFTEDTTCLLQPFWIVLLFHCFAKATISNNCDVAIHSTADGQKNGTFNSPNWPSPYGTNLRCVYHLIGLPNERVQIRFLEFEVKGVPPRCVHDYIDVYTQAKEPNPDLLDVPLHGRYCGTGMDLLPRLLISMHNIFILGFYTDHQKEERGFLAEYTFINGSVYNAGTPAPASVCGQTVNGGGSRSDGVLLSPTYPGMYPDNIFCFYRLHGVTGQRIRLTFIDVDLYSGGEHCPFDYIRVYDGPDNKSHVIGTYCGRIKNVSVYSSVENLYIEFVTKSGRVEPTRRSYLAHWESHKEEADIQRRGFKATFEISNEFVDLDFIHEGSHVRGTECDQMVLSTGESSGTITSPNYPGDYPLNITCHYYIDGLVDKHHLEKAKLFLDEFDIPVISGGCSNGYLSAYLRGQDITKELPDEVFCGRTLPDPLVTSNPRLLLLFNTSNARITGHGFKARFQFLTDYAIPGTPATDGAKCHFLYRSTAAVHGTFNSPRHPSNYPDNTTCIYEFMGLPTEQVRITFENFKVENNKNNCWTDYIQVYIYTTRSLESGDSSELLIGHYCGNHTPGPQLSEDNFNMMRIMFISNNEGINTGFRAKYEFIEKKPTSKRCFYDITSGGGGQIFSENYPHKYLINSTCEWRISSKQRGARILLMFDIFSMEGKPDSLGCGNAVLKVYTNNSGQPSHELCGSSSQGEAILSQGNFMRLKFISSARAVGNKGFKLTWTEILSMTSEGNSCTGFLCKVSGFCIASELKCNKMPNCGKGDVSDESTECNSYRDHGLLHIILGVVFTLVALLVFIIICILHRRRKARIQKDKKDIEVRYVTRAPALNRAGSACSDRLLKEKTEKVSIV